MDELKISPIRNGTAIDHIKAGQALNVLKILNVNENTVNSSVSIAMHVPSSKEGWKDIVKIEDRELDNDTVNKIALIAPNATIAIIRDFNVTEKNKVSIENHVRGIARCSNPNCITNKGEPVEPEFDVVSRDPPVLKCSYCERTLNNIYEHLL